MSGNSIEVLLDMKDGSTVTIHCENSAIADQIRNGVVDHVEVRVEDPRPTKTVFSRWR